MNHTAVVPSLAFDEARAFAESAEAVAEELEPLYVTRLDSARIAKLHRQQSLALRLAKVHAELAVAEELRALRAFLVTVEDQR